MKLKSTIERFTDSKIWYYHIPVSKEQGDPFCNENDRRIIATINGKIVVHCALMPYPEGYFILMNKKNLQKLGLDEGDSVEVNIEKEINDYGIPVPESFLYLLAEDEVGAEYFEALTPGKKRSLIYLVNQVKNVDKQINKGLAILDHLTSAKGKLDFKELMATIKQYNQRDKLKN